MRHVYSALLLLISVHRAYPGSPVTIALQFDHPYSQISIDEMKNEVQALLADSGVQLEWVAKDQLLSSQAYSRLVVLKLRGSCDGSQPIRALDGGSALGYTYLSAGEPMPFSEVECDRVRSLLSSARTSSNFGRALGRVVAHELRHILDRTSAHTRSSYTRKSLSAADLIAELPPRH